MVFIAINLYFATIFMPHFQAIEHIFFDLDHTLWDYNSNCKDALFQMVKTHGLEQLGVTDVAFFYQTFNTINERLWDLYDSRQISQVELRVRRFKEVFESMNLPNIQNFEHWNDIYLEISPNLPHLIDGAVEILEYLAPKYHLHIITNGFDEIQNKKLVAGQILHYFKEIITSQSSGYRKPENGIFKYAFEKTNATPKNAVMIGDNPNTDILGAHKLDMFYIFYNPTEQTFNLNENWQVKHLEQIKTFL